MIPSFLNDLGMILLVNKGIDLATYDDMTLQLCSILIMTVVKIFTSDQRTIHQHEDFVSSTRHRSLHSVDIDMGIDM